MWVPSWIGEAVPALVPSMQGQHLLHTFCLTPCPGLLPHSHPCAHVPCPLSLSL